MSDSPSLPSLSLSAQLLRVQDQEVEGEGAAAVGREVDTFTHSLARMSQNCRLHRCLPPENILHLPLFLRFLLVRGARVP